jgi:hypothetical protein
MNGFGNSIKIYGYVQSVALIHIQLSIQAVMKANVETSEKTRTHIYIYMVFQTFNTFRTMIKHFFYNGKRRIT